MRGLKHDSHEHRLAAVCVAPCMGAWIETFSGAADFLRVVVAPCMGAWIETFISLFTNALYGRTLYGCVD